jgi:coenzyme F420 hydrogenase subunit beta
MVDKTEMIPITEIKGHRELVKEVIKTGLCIYCGACADACPYLIASRGRIVVLDNCDRTEGQCYQFCPRTFTDMDAVARKIFGRPFGTAEFGPARELLLARSTDKQIQDRCQDGGVVTTLLYLGLEAGIIDAALAARMNEGKTPHGFVARTKEELLECSGTSYEPCPTLQTLNRLPDDSHENLGIVSLPCHAEAIAKMKTYSTRNRVSIENVKLVIGLFCGWTLAEGFHRFMEAQFDLAAVKKFDIPHHPGHTFDAFYEDGGKKEIELEDIRDFINPACTFCWDMTAEFADISVGSGRAKYRGWNTLIVRTEAGAEIVALARKKGLLETQPLPEENVVNLKRASLNKKKRALRELKAKYHGQLGYLGLSEATARQLLSD